jgi:hypothetical protein
MDIQTLLAHHADKPDYFTKSCDLLFKIAVFENGNTSTIIFLQICLLFFIAQ